MQWWHKQSHKVPNKVLSLYCDICVVPGDIVIQRMDNIWKVVKDIPIIKVSYIYIEQISLSYISANSSQHSFTEITPLLSSYKYIDHCLVSFTENIVCVDSILDLIKDTCDISYISKMWFLKEHFRPGGVTLPQNTSDLVINFFCAILWNSS